MKKMIMRFLVMTLMTTVMALPAFATEKTDAEILDAHNKICRVTGYPVSGEDFAVYKGKRYNLCCPMCKRSLREILDREARGK